ncbi:MAG: hypothetical protein LBT76_06860, partial [Tannerella sp.]|nr:hypothetical protein [Tannerella sp.]
LYQLSYFRNIFFVLPGSGFEGKLCTARRAVFANAPAKVDKFFVFAKGNRKTCVINHVLNC